jgi:aspartokinase
MDWINSRTGVQSLPNPEALEKVSISGLKVSDPLVGFLVRGTNDPSDHRRLAASLAEARINLPLVTLEEGETGGGMFFCTARGGAAAEALSLLDMELSRRRRYRCLDPVGLISVYPTRSNPVFLGRGLATLSAAGFPVHALATTLSALTLATDFHRLEEAVEALTRVFILPEGHAPFRGDIQIVPTLIVKDQDE